MTTASSVADALLGRLAPDQRAAATAPPGPVLCIAPAGSGKTTTLVARIAWLLESGVDAGSVTAIAFNTRAASELAARLGSALDTLGGGGVRVRTFHALGLEILREAGWQTEPLVDRAALLRRLFPSLPSGELRHLDTAISRLKLDLRLDPAAIAADPDAGPRARAFCAYERALTDKGLDFDDQIARSLRLLEADPAVLATWRARCLHLLVDEAQDLDRSQLDLALLLAAPANQVFLVGDDDQSIYGWRLADVRRVLGLADRLPGLRRVDLEVNYRCPRPVVERAVRLVSHNAERFVKAVRPGPVAAGRLILAPSNDDDAGRAERILLAWPDDETPRAILARTNRELAAAAVAAIEADRPFRASGVELVVESPLVDEILQRIATDTDAGQPLLLRVGRIRSAILDGPRDADADLDAATRADVVEAILGWAPRFATLGDLVADVARSRERLAALRRDDAPLSLATAHGTKGLEFDDVAVLDMDAHRFPSARSLSDAAEPERALEEERRLAYVAWTRARRSLILVYDPAAPSPFLLEAFSAAELGLGPGGSTRVAL
ncbi:MAG: ATP-dependent helicase [Chloroflexi bacterium]|nr:ATP-dependent helicase [Chloroflexota bacterium]